MIYFGCRKQESGYIENLKMQYVCCVINKYMRTNTITHKQCLDDTTGKCFFRGVHTCNIFQ